MNNITITANTENIITIISTSETNIFESIDRDTYQSGISKIESLFFIHKKRLGSAFSWCQRRRYLQKRKNKKNKKMKINENKNKTKMKIKKNKKKC